MTNEYEALGKELLDALWNLDDKFPLDTHPDAWKAIEQFAEKLQSAAYAEGRKDEAEVRGPAAEPFGYIVDFDWGVVRSKVNLYSYADPARGIVVPVYLAAPKDQS